MGELDEFDLDPGIRRLVMLLRAHGFDTTDSGDGVTKLAAGDAEALPFPHVFMVCEPVALVHVAERLLAVLADEGIVVAENGTGGAEISAIFDPVNSSTVILLTGATDSFLPGEPNR